MTSALASRRPDWAQEANALVAQLQASLPAAGTELALDHVLVAILEYARSLEATMKSPTAPVPDAAILGAVEGLLRAVLQFISSPRLPENAQGGTVQLDARHLRALYASRALHAALAATYGRASPAALRRKPR